MLTSTNSGLRWKKLLRFTKNLRSWRISQSQSRLLGLEGDVKTKSRLLDWDFSIVETSFLKLSRFSQRSRLTFCQCSDQESWLRHDLDKSRPPGLCMNPFIISVMDAIKLCNKIENFGDTQMCCGAVWETLPQSLNFFQCLWQVKKLVSTVWKMELDLDLSRLLRPNIITK
jgi:hypothetical protein